MDWLRLDDLNRRELLARTLKGAGLLAGAAILGCRDDAGMQASSWRPSQARASATPFRNARTNAAFATLREALDASQSGDTIKMAGGTYVINGPDDIGSTANIMSGLNYGVLLDSLTLEWETPGDAPLIDMSPWAEACNNSGGDCHGIIMGQSCTNLTVRGIHIRGFRGDYGLNSGIYIMSGYGQGINYATPANLTVEYCKLYEFTNGILTRPYYNFSLDCRYTVFQDNGKGDGLSHGLYVSDNLAASFLGCTFSTTANSKPQPGLGHLIKSRARTTTVRACLFDPKFGTATCIDVCNGGIVEITGNIILRYGAALFADDNPVIKYGEEQQPYYNANSPSWGGGGDSKDTFVHDGRVHSLVLAQNTIRSAQPEGGIPFAILQLRTPTSDWTQGGVPTPQASGGTGGDLELSLSTTIRNNIVGSDLAQATNFVSDYPSNSAVAYDTIDDLGFYSGGIIPGSPPVNDAKFAWEGDFKLPAARTDSDRGGRISGDSAVRPTAPSSLRVE